jgi:hypothetical protein
VQVHEGHRRQKTMLKRAVGSKEAHEHDGGACLRTRLTEDCFI